MPETPEIIEYKMLRHRDLSEFQRRMTECACLGEILDADWVKRVRETIDKVTPDYLFADKAFHLFRLLNDEDMLLQRLDTSIAVLEPLARVQNKLRPFKESVVKLRGKEENQIEAAMFELIVLGNLATLCDAGKCSILLYPIVGTGNSNIEAKIKVNNRWNNIEAKLFGYSPHDVSPQVDFFVSDPQRIIDRVKYAIIGKTGDGIQLATISPDEPSVLCMAPGYDPMFAFMEEGIRAAFEINNGSPSAVMQYGYHFRISPKLYLNPHAHCPLTEHEIQFLKRLL